MQHQRATLLRLLGLACALLVPFGQGADSIEASSCSTTFELFTASQNSHLSIASQLLVNSAARTVLPSPGDGITLFLPEDEAFGSLSFNQSALEFNYSFVGAASVELALSSMPAGKLASLLLYWALPAPLDQEGLRRLGASATGLSLVTQSPAFNLGFTSNGSQTVVKGNFQSGSVVKSYAVCASWVHTTGSLLWPSSTPDISYLPDPIVGGRYAVTGDASKTEVPLASAVFGLDTLAAAQTAAQDAQRRAELVPILGGVLAGMLAAILLLLLATVVVKWLRAKKHMKQIQQDLEAQFRKDFVHRGGSASMRAKGSSDRVLAQMLSAQQDSAKLAGGSSAQADYTSYLRGQRPSRQSSSASHELQRPSTGRGVQASSVRPGVASPGGTSEGGSRNLSLADSVGPRGGSLLPADSADSLRGSLGAAWQDMSWQIDPSEVEILKDAQGRDCLLGQGGYGSVYKARMSGTTIVACKLMDRQSARELERFAEEVEILKDLRHINIVQFLGAFFRDGRLGLVTEYLAGGNLQEALGRDMQRDLSWYSRGHQIALDVVRAVLHMHSRRVLHLDLKAANVLLARDGTAKVADVGLSKVLSREATNVSIIGSFDYLAPEVLTGQACSEKADIWSLGCVLWVIVTGETIRMRQLRPVRVPEECPEEVRAVIQDCRSAAPSNRPSARQVFDRLRESIANTR